jgi:murein DD-endopeptidase MepM/ murein hydrolase activator NlpD
VISRNLCLAALTLYGAGCAGPQRVTWNEAAPTTARVDEAPAETEPVVEKEEAAPVGGVEAPRRSAGLAVDRALQTFLAARVVLRAVPPTARQHGEAWQEVLERIDEACVLQPAANDLGAFVRARATLEVELEQDRRRRVLLPEDLKERLERTLAAVDQGVDELRMIAAPGTLRPSPRMSAGAVVLHQPLATMNVSSPFGVRADPFNGFERFHAGVDLRAKEGVMVYAAAPGTVVYAGWQGGFGRHVVVDHGDGFRTHYSHLNAMFVQAGQLVDGRDSIGAVGSTGRSTGPHLHFAVTNASGSFLDPLMVLGVPLERGVVTPVSRSVAMTR